MVAKGLYITCRQWDSVLSGLPYPISGDTRFVMGDADRITAYRPIPFDDFSRSSRRLETFQRLTYRDMHEDIDRDNLQAATVDSSLAYFLVCGAFIRVRQEDKKSLDSSHTLLIVGAPDKVLEASEALELPHPFDKALYPYRGVFTDTSGTIDVLI